MSVRVLSVASEVWPLIKTGGLADVAGALPPALAPHGVETVTLVPGYPAVLRALGKASALPLPDLLGTPARLLRATVGALDLLVLDAPTLFDRLGGPYSDTSGADWPDNWHRFAALSLAAAEIAGGALPAFQPDIVHAHDWQAALALAYIRYRGLRVPGVVTVHNLAFQGRFPASIFPDLELPAEAFAIDGVEYYGGVGYLKAGMEAADAITTVSPTYAQEIRTPEFGMGLEGLVNARAGRLHGIVNGIDVTEWDPAADRHLASSYSLRAVRPRLRNRRAVEKRFGLGRAGGPIFCVVSRLTWQKGMDLLAELVDPLVAAGGRLALLGSGDGALEAAFLAAAERHRGRVGVVIGYDEGLSHLLQGGADAILIPSRFEPCGLTQLYGQRYGCVPIVARTGGLADTVIDANEAALELGVATGFQFAPTTASALGHAIARASAAFARPKTWAGIVKRGMKMDFSWERSAGRYAALYRSLLPAPEAP